jgi:omega-6 fatty acid desaturase (delta-12 desaturase)
VAVADSPSPTDYRERQRSFATLARRLLYLPLAIFSADLLLYCLSLWGAIGSDGLLARAFFAVLAGVAISLLAIVAHDAIHNSFTSLRWLNRIIGTLAFLPALHPYSRWQHHHNRVHHIYTAQLGLDNAYAPMTVREYAAASQRVRAAYRFKRSLAGQLVYYLIYMWLPKMFLPGKNERNQFRAVDWIDLALVYTWLVGMLGGLTVLVASQAGGSPARAFLDVMFFGVLIPFFVWNVFISFVTIVQHTGPDVRWISPTGSHSTSAEKLRGTVHLALPRPIDWLFHRVMQHPAHHIHSGVPLYSLRRAEEELSARLPALPVFARWTPLYHWRLTRDCKLYDPSAQRWCGFSLRPISGP